MPELPEVETLAKGLQSIVGYKIVRIHFFRSKLRENIPTEKISKLVTGKRVVAVSRRGKYLLFTVSDGGKETTNVTLISHLGMSGVFCLLRQNKDSQKDFQSHTHFYIKLNKGDHSLTCAYSDPRRFGRLSFMEGSDNSLENHRFLKGLGIEPLEVSAEVLASHMAAKAKSKRAHIKGFLLNQGVVAGIGNIYASESLYVSGIMPNRVVSTLKTGEWQRLALGIQSVLQKAIELGGSTLKDFHHLDGQQGYFSLNAQVYMRDGQACEICGGTVKKSYQQNRSTYYCVTCQH
ncbi:MAG: bifunctional DNA-formamidopyrimidine glycosylase/DNA-(apurinic or apyrimidinic site) lyase [Proteobacteria bacterium]|nr:bifunctional DNA-formamidopyrimidine glycosylase/DNA-(apurinic or apyrimidinic site) lyase [Pseudomonadota bacterium]